MAFTGIDVRENGTELLLRAYVQDVSGADVTAGPTFLYLYEFQPNGTLKSFDFADNTFKATAVTTEKVAMVHQTGNAGTTLTGIWTYAQTVLTGFTPGNIYAAKVTNSAGPSQTREFQFGLVEGDPATQVWNFNNRSLTTSIPLVIDQATLVAALESIIVITGLTERFTTPDGTPVATIGLARALQIILTSVAGDRTGVGTREIAAQLPGVPAKVTADRISSTEIHSTVVVQ